jgi:YbgC/YbaW family acyl-CoA thioester hydrolase
MTRWARFLLTVFRSLFKPRLQVDQDSLLTFRVWPTEADLTLMNHATYLTIMEQGRIDFIRRTGFMQFLLRRRWSAVLASITVQYRIPLRRFQRYQLRTRVACWDDKWLFLEHHMSRGTDLVASGLAKIAVLGPSGRIEPADALGKFGLKIARPALAPMVRALQEGERLMHERIRDWPAPDWSLEGEQNAV